MKTLDTAAAYALQSAQPSRIQIALTLEACASITAFVGSSGISIGASWIRDYFHHSNPVVGGFEILKMLNSLGMVFKIHIQCDSPFDNAVSPSLLFGHSGQLMYLAKPAPMSSQLSGHTKDSINRLLPVQTAEQMCVFWIIDADDLPGQMTEKLSTYSGGPH